MKPGRVLFVAACAAGVAMPVRADVVFVPASRDNTLYEDTLGALSSGSGPTIFAGATNVGFKRRALIRFDVGQAIPVGATVTGVTLALHLSMTISADMQVSLHRALVDWGEGASSAIPPGGQGAPAAPGDATWLHTFHPAQFWHAPGGGPGLDYVAQASAITAVGNPLVQYTWESTPALVADVQGWLGASPPGANFGWFIIGDETAAGTAKRFGSRENKNNSLRPILTVTFTPPSPPCVANCDGSTGSPRLTGNDFQCFINAYANALPYANCDQSTGNPLLTANDFQCFVNAYAAGCS